MFLASVSSSSMTRIAAVLGAARLTVGYLRAAHSGIRPWGGPSGSLVHPWRGAPSLGEGAIRARGGPSRSRGDRQEDDDLGAASLLARDPHAAAEARDDALDERQS